MNLLFAGDVMLPSLLVDADAPVGGWAVQQLQLANALVLEGHRVGFLVPKADYTGVQCRCELVQSCVPGSGIPKLRFFYPGLSTTLSVARRFNPDAIVQSCSGHPTAAMAWVAGRLNIPFVHRLACDTDSDGREGLYLRLPSRLSFRYGLKRARFVVCQNAHQLEHIKRRFPDKPASILHNAIADSGAERVSRPRAQRPYFAWLAVFRKQKNLPLLLRLACQFPRLEFRVAGAPSADLDPDSAAAVDGLKRLDNVCFVGYLRRSAVADFLRGAVALLCTSDYEGFSNTFLEAFAAGTPVVARRMVDPDSIVERNRLGFVAGDEQELAAGVRAVYSLDASSYESLSLRCRHYVETHHTPAAAARKLVAMLEPLVTGAARPISPSVQFRE